MVLVNLTCTWPEEDRAGPIWINIDNIATVHTANDGHTYVRLLGESEAYSVQETGEEIAQKVAQVKAEAAFRPES